MLRRWFVWFYRCRRHIKDWLFFLFSSDWQVEQHNGHYKLYENGAKEFEGRLEDLPVRLRAKWMNRLAQLDDLDDQCREMAEQFRQRR